MSPRFVHLHLHSEYSLTDSTIRIPELVKRCVQSGLPAVALTDQSNLFALVKFYKEAEKAGIKPIAGADIWLEEDGLKPSRLTLLCQDRSGYLNLSALLSRAYLEGHRGDFVAIRPEWLQQANAGLIVLAGRDSDVGQISLEGKLDRAAARLERWQRHFGDRFYLEVTRTQRGGEDEFFSATLALAAQRDCAVVASNDVRFLEAEDFEAHEARVCISTGRVLTDPRRPRDFSTAQYLKSTEEMAALFADHPAVLENAVEIAKRCNLELSLGKYYLPAFPVPAEHTIDSWLRNSALAGLEARLAKHPVAAGHTRESYLARLDLELDVILKMGFPGYFLIVADFINWAKKHDIPVGPGRGSGAGSLVAWALGITDLDPIPYDLLFERFLNPERVSMPDFDIDFCMDKRDDVIQYVAEKYGRDRVSQIITYGTMAAKAVVRDTGRVLDHPYGFVDSIAKLIPMTLGITLDDALGRSEAAQKNTDLASTELIQRYQSEDEVRDLIDLALKLEDLTRNAGKHAGGVVIAPSPLSEFSPLFAEQAAKGETARSIVTQFDKDDVEAVGLVKFDFLGLRTLTILDWAVKAINRRRASNGEDELDLLALALDDARTYRMFASGETVAVFQFESRGMRELLKRAKPDTFEDIIALAALFRPGPLGSGMDREWVDRKHGNTAVTYPHPLAGTRARANLRRDRVPGTGDADRAGAGRLFARRRRPAAPRHGQEEARGDGEGAHQVRARVRRTRDRRDPGLVDLRPDGEVRRIRIQQVALGRLCAGGLPHRLAQDPLPRGVHGGGAVVRHGQHRKGRGFLQRSPLDAASGAGSRRERLGLHVRSRGRAHHSLRPGRSEGRRAWRVRGHRDGARAQWAIRRPVRLLPSGRCHQAQQARARSPGPRRRARCAGSQPRLADAAAARSAQGRRTARARSRCGPGRHVRQCLQRRRADDT
jgi:DNA polymerase-3 subunit alpha